MNKQLFKALFFALLSFILPNTLWAADPDLENAYTLVKSVTFGDAEAVNINCSGACDYTAYDTGNKKQQALTIATAPADAAGWIAFQAWTDGSDKGWWNRANNSLYCYNAGRSAAVFGSDLTTGWIVVFEGKSKDVDIENVITLANAEGEPDGPFTYFKSDDKTKYFCTITAESNAHVGFCGNKNAQGIKKISVYKPNNPVQKATYTVKYTDNNGLQLQDPKTYEGIVGNPISLLDADKANIKYNEKTYLYLSDDAEGKTVTADGTIVTVKFKLALNYDYTVNELCGQTIVRTTTGTGYESEVVHVPYRKYNAVNGQLYSKGATNKEYNYSFTIIDGQNTQNVEYAAVDGVKNVVFCAEGEDIDGLTKITSGNTTIRSSNSASAYATEDTRIFTLEPGKYKIHAAIYDASKEPNSHWIFKTKYTDVNNQEVETTVADFNCTTVNIQEFDSEEFTVTETAELIMAAGGGNNMGLDAIYIQKTVSILTTDWTPKPQIDSSPFFGLNATGEYAYGDEVEFSVNKELSGYDFIELTDLAGNKINPSESTNGFRITLTSNYTVVAHYQQQAAQTFKLTLTPNPANSGNSVKAYTDEACKTEVADYNAVSGDVWVKAFPASTNDYMFVSFNVVGVEGLPLASDNPTKFTIDKDTEIKANFTKIYALTLSVNPENSGTAKAYSDRECTKEITNLSAIPEGVEVWILATPATGYEFENWTGVNVDQIFATDKANVTMNNDLTFTANFKQTQTPTPTQFTLTYSSANETMGTVAATLATGASVASGSKLDADTKVKLTATATEGYEFVNWTGVNNDDIFTTAEIEVTMDNDRSYQANFKKSTPAPTGIIYYWLDGTEQANSIKLADDVTLTLTGNKDKKYQSALKIKVDGTEYTSIKVSNKAQNTIVLPTNAKSVTFYSYVNKEAATERAPYWSEVNGVSYTEETSGGTMTSYQDGSKPDVRTYTFEKPTNTFTFTNAGEQLCFVMKVEYAPTPTTYTITANANPTEGGTVTGAGTYNEGATVTLKATANEGYKFLKWESTGNEFKTDAEFSFTATADIEWTAQFEQEVPPTPVENNIRFLTLLNKNLFYQWDGYGANAKPQDLSGDAVEVNIGKELGQGGVVAGSGSVWHLHYADLSSYSKILFEGTEGMVLRILMNRQESDNGPLTEKYVTFTDGKAELDLSEFDYVHLNAIKVNWGSSGTVTSIKLLKPASAVAYEWYPKGAASRYQGAARQAADGSYEVYVRSEAQAREAGNATLDGDKLASWDSQFFVTFGEKNALNAGDKLKLTMDVKATQATSVGTQSHKAPGGYIHWYCVGDVSFTDSWSPYSSAEVEVTGERDQSGKAQEGMYTIAFNLATGAENTYSFRNIDVIVDPAPVPIPITYALIAENDPRTYYKKEFPKTAIEIAEPDADGVVTVKSAAKEQKKDAQGNPLFDDKNNPVMNDDWDCQFWIRLPQAVAAGTKIKIGFEYKATANATVNTQSHSEPGDYIHWVAIGDVNFTTGWQTFENEVTVSSDMSKTDKMMHSIAFNLMKNDAITYSFRNVKVYVDEKAVTTPDYPKGLVIFAAGDAQGIAPAQIEAELGSSITIPVNRTLYEEDKTLTSWNYTDGNEINVFKPTETMLVKHMVTNLNPVFTENNVSLFDREGEIVLDWQLGHKNGGGDLNYEGKTGVAVIQATIKGETIDVPLLIDATNGKANNIGRPDEWAQINKGTKFTIPSFQGATVEMNAYEEIATTTIDGVADYEAGKTITYVIPEMKETSEIVVNDGAYYSYVKVTIPDFGPEKKITVKVFSTGTGDYTIDPEKKTHRVGEKVTITATAAEGFKFAEWLTADGASLGTENPLSIIVADDMLIYAKFTEDDGEEDVLLGDANLDGEVTVSDAVLTVNFALGVEVPSDLQKKAADVNKDNELTVADAVGIVNIALGNDAAGVRMLDEGSNSLTLRGNELSLSNTTEFVAFQMDVTLNDGSLLNGVTLSDRASNLRIDYNRVGQNTWRIAAFSTENEAITRNSGKLVTFDISGDPTMTLTSIEFVDAYARQYPMGFGDVTGINGMGYANSNADIYTIDGVKNNTMRKGVNVVRSAAGEVKKVLVK